MENIDAVFFLQLFIALVTVFLTIFFKVVSRNDRLARFRRDDLAFGFDISSTALVLFVIGMVNLATRITDNSSSIVNTDIDRALGAPWILFAFFVWHLVNFNRKSMVWVGTR